MGRRKSSLSKEKIAEVLSQPFQLWPPAKPGQKYGPSKKQQLLFIDQMPDHVRPHKHNQDLLLYIGGARCLGLDTPILMYDGTIKPVQEVIVGDLLMGPDSQSRRVESLSRGREKMYKVIPVKGDPWTCNESHIVSLKTSGKRTHCTGWGKNKVEHLDTGSIENISILDYLGLSNKDKKSYKLYQSPEVVFGEESELLIDPYFLGLWLGDGHKDGPSVTNIDKEVIEYLYNYAEECKLKVTVQTKANKNVSSYHLSTGNVGFHNRNPLMNHLRKYNLVFNKHIPSEYLTSSKNQRLELLAGLVDSDGYVNKGYIEITQKIKQLSEDIAFLARSLGFRAVIKEVQKYCMYKGEKKTGNYYRVSIIGHLQEVPTKILRKQLPIRKHYQDPLVTGFSLEAIGEGDYYGFEISGPDRLFLLGDFTVTHNSGKSASGVARALDIALRYPGSNIIYGAKTLKDLKDIVIDEFKKRLTIINEWDHPYVLHVPNAHDNYLTLQPPGQKASKVLFMQMSEVIRLRGREADLVIVEEATQLPDSKALEEMVRRLSSNLVPILQIILVTNPPEQRNWLYDKFALKQFTPAYKASGEPPLPIGSPCNCQFCQLCLNPADTALEAKEVLWDKSRTCPDCGNKKDNDCPGNQQYTRVIETSSMDNRHLPSTYVSNAMSGMDKDTAALYIKGEFIELRKGYVYWAFDDTNILPRNEEIDWEKDIVWSHDFNFAFQCSVICQEHGSPGEEIVYVVDELVIPETRSNGPQYIAKEFIQKLKSQCLVTNGLDIEKFDKFKKERTIIIYGDPNGHNRLGGSSEASSYQIIINELKKEGFKVKIMIKREKGSQVMPISLKVNSTNAMFKDKDKNIRIFVNPKCVYLIAGLEGVKFKADGKHIDDGPDKRAAEATDKSIIYSLTHPTDSLAYFVARRFPSTEKQVMAPFTLIPNEELIELNTKTKEVKVENYTKDKHKSSASLLDFLSRESMEDYEVDISSFRSFWS